MRRGIAVIGTAALAMTLVACSGGGGGESASGGAESDGGTSTGAAAWEGDDSEVQVMTWWESGSEKEGLQALQKVFEEKFPDTEFVNAAIAGGGGSQAKQKLAADLAAGNPPDTFQAHAGAEMTDYIEAGQVEDLTGLYDELGLDKAFPQDLLDRLTMDGKIYSVPSNIHRANVVWANPTVLKDSGVDP
ncbi:MAG: ABC transporter substrate-binding protein, partial [Actinomyces sp.]|nr:ABC transporter substrate-binding protein [Actinomyces sp.]